MTVLCGYTSSKYRPDLATPKPRVPRWKRLRTARRQRAKQRRALLHGQRVAHAIGLPVREVFAMVHAWGGWEARHPGREDDFPWLLCEHTHRRWPL